MGAGIFALAFPLLRGWFVYAYLVFWQVLGMMQGGLEVCARCVGGLSSLRGALMGRSAEWERKGVAGPVTFVPMRTLERVLGVLGNRRSA